uniref:LIM zinc-binding domain-containing protein n=1 Tax=Gopherus evgoodei TaxID=1825980 RepID=A0A8C4Y5F6_9SAUR
MMVQVTPGACFQPPICAGCDMPISDRFLLQVNERSWHEGCVKCAACDCLGCLNGSASPARPCPTASFPPWPHRLFQTKCSSCLKAIAPSEFIMRVLENVYHVHCFFCCECERRLHAPSAHAPSSPLSSDGLSRPPLRFLPNPAER